MFGIKKLTTIIEDRISSTKLMFKMTQEIHCKIFQKVDDKNIQQISDRIDTFNLNFKRFEVMVNEFKGMISMTRGNLNDVKNHQEMLKKYDDVIQKIRDDLKKPKAVKRKKAVKPKKIKEVSPI